MQHQTTYRLQQTYNGSGPSLDPNMAEALQHQVVLLKGSLGTMIGVVAMWLKGHKLKSLNWPLANASQSCLQQIRKGCNPSLDPTQQELYSTIIAPKIYERANRKMKLEGTTGYPLWQEKKGRNRAKRLKVATKKVV